jgi:hypothetical protein
VEIWMSTIHMKETVMKKLYPEIKAVEKSIRLEIPHLNGTLLYYR